MFTMVTFSGVYHVEFSKSTTASGHQADLGTALGQLRSATNLRRRDQASGLSKCRDFDTFLEALRPEAVQDP